MTAVRRSVLLNDGRKLADSYMKGRTQNLDTFSVKAPRVGNTLRRLQPTKSKTVVMANQRVWYTVPGDADNTAVEQGQLLSIRGESAAVLSAGGKTKLIPLQNLEDSWKTRLIRMGFNALSVPSLAQA